MKNYLILAMILITGMTAYPQATRTEKESKSEKRSSRTEASQRSASRAESRSASAQKAAAARPERSRQESVSSPVLRSRSESAARTESRPRSESRTINQNPVTRSNEQNRVSRSNEQERVTRSSNESSRQQDVRSGAERTRVTRSASENAGRNEEAVRVQSGNDRDLKVNNSSASRIYREGRGTLTRDDGTVIRHQNDEVFRSNKYKLDYDNYENLRRSDDFRRDYRDYDDWNNHRRIRVINHYHNNFSPLSWELRRSRYYYRAPYHIDLIWTPLLFHRFMFYYPTNRNWDMEFGSQIETVSADQAQEYAGSVRRVYGKVDEVYYSPEDENYILYIGSPFPYQDLSVVIPRHIAQRFSLSPKWFFDHEFVWVVGLINMWEGKPEIVVRDEDQIQKY